MKFICSCICFTVLAVVAQGVVPDWRPGKIQNLVQVCGSANPASIQNVENAGFPAGYHVIYQWLVTATFDSLGQPINWIGIPATNQTAYIASLFNVKTAFKRRAILKNCRLA